MNTPDSSQTSNGTETYDALRARIRDRFDGLTPHLQRIARSALEEPNHFALNTVVVIAEHVGVQPSTLIRFAKEFGYRGFSQLQRVFRLRLIEGPPDKRARVYDMKEARVDKISMDRVFGTCIDELIASLESARQNTDPADLRKAVTMIDEAHHVHIAGLRRARAVATYLSYGLLRAERQCSLLDFAGGMAEQQIVNMASDDLLICVSFPPYATPVLDIIRDAHLRRRNIIAITDSFESPLAKNSTLAFAVDNDTPSQFKPISGAIALVQAICVAMTN